MYRGYGVPLFLTVLSWCWFLLLAGGTVTWLHLRRAYDVIHVHNMPDFLVFSAFVPRLLGVKVILDVQDISPELMSAKATKPQKRLVTFLATWQEGLSAAFADSVVTVGWPFEEQLLKRGVPREKLTVILNSADPKQFPPSRLCYEDTETGESARPFIVMYHGTLAKRNGLDVAMRAFALACRDVDGLRLDTQGRGEQLPMLKQLAVELGVQDRVIFTDYCPPEKMVDFVVHGDVGIIPYPCDGFMELVLPTKAY
jgi:glycosyltransferase involved in cell wall biosynthesis